MKPVSGQKKLYSGNGHWLCLCSAMTYSPKCVTDFADYKMSLSHVHQSDLTTAFQLSLIFV